MCEQEDKSQLEAEYQFLRKEIEDNHQKMFNSTTFSLPLSIGILAYAFESNSPWIALSIFPVTFFMLSKQVRYRQSTYRIATYLRIFLEPKLGIKWESRLYEIEKTEERARKKEKKVIQRLKHSEWTIMGCAALLIFTVRSIVLENGHYVFYFSRILDLKVSGPLLIHIVISITVIGAFFSLWMTKLTKQITEEVKEKAYYEKMFLDAKKSEDS